MLLPVVLALLASINTLNNSFAFDDTDQILNNGFIQKLSNLPAAFTQSVWSFYGEDIIAAQDAYYRPLFTALFIINHAMFGTAAWGWHLVSVLIHTVVVFFVFLVCREVTGRDWVALTAAILFAAHPVHAESVAWISGVTDPLMALFALPSFYCYLRYRKTGLKLLLALSLAFYLPALLSKETAFVLLPVIAWCELFHFDDPPSLRTRAVRAIMLSGLFIVPTALYFLMRYQAIGNLVTNTNSRYSLGHILMTVPLALAKYLKLIFVPSGYSIQHFTALVTSVTNPGFIGPVVLIVAVVSLVLIIKSRALSFAALWFIVWLALPLAGIGAFQLLYLVQERYLYLPSVGACLAVALGLEYLAGRRWFGFQGRAAAIALAVAATVILGTVTLAQNRVWRNTVSLYHHCVRSDPRAPLARTALAGAYFAERRYREAEIEAQTALDLDPTCIDAYLVLSVFAYSAGKTDQAIKHLERAETMVTEGPQKRGYLGKIYSKLGFLYNQTKQYNQAEQYLSLAAETTPYMKTWYELAGFYFDQRRYQEARDLLEKALTVTSPRFAPIHLKLARAYDRLGEREQARAAYQKYLELAPGAEESRAVMKRLSEL